MDAYRNLGVFGRLQHESLRQHCTNDRRVRKWDKKVRRDVI